MANISQTFIEGASINRPLCLLVKTIFFGKLE